MGNHSLCDKSTGNLSTSDETISCTLGLFTPARKVGQRVLCAGKGNELDLGGQGNLENLMSPIQGRECNLFKLQDLSAEGVVRC